MRRFKAFTAAIFTSLFLSSVATAQPLPTDSRLVTGTLDNGLKYIVRKHDNPPGRVSIWLHISTGSLNETDAQRGIAHYLEHMAFNGSKNFPPGTVVPYFESIGLTFGRHQNAFTSFDQTTYQLALPNTQPETIAKGMLFMSDVATRLALPAEEIDKERQVIMEEKRARSGAQQRIQEYVLSRIAPGSLIGDRLPIGTEQTINGVQRPDFEAYYGTWYTPANMTVMVVADADPAMVVEQIKQSFGGGERRPAPADQDPKVTPTAGMRAIIATDPDLTEASISISRIDRAEPPTTTVELARRDLVRQIGTAAYNRRIDAKVSKGGMPFLRSGASSSTLFRAGRWTQASADGKPENWKEMLATLTTELQRARLHGFTQREIDDVKTQIRSSLDQFVQREKTLDTRRIISMMNNSVADGEPIMSAEQEREITGKLLDGVTAEEISREFARQFDMSSCVFVLEIPSGGDVPSEEALVALGKAALDVKPEKEAETARATTLLAKAPTPGDFVDQGVHAASDVWSGWLSNGVRVHQRTMDYKKDEVSVTITLAAGVLQETPANRGISEVAGLAWSRAATSTLSSTDIRDLMTGKKVRVNGGGAATDSMTLSVSGSPADLESGLQLAYLLLTDPQIEPAAFDQWKTQQLQSIAAREKEPQAAFRVLLSQSIFPEGDVRFQPLTAEQVNALSRDAAQAWLKNAIATAPIEVAVVGDMPRDAALALVKTYLGSLPKRERISAATLDDLRKVKRPAGPIARSRQVATQTPVAMVMSGFYGPDADNLPEARAMEIASTVLSTRMIKEIREEKQLVYSIGAQSQPGRTLPGMGIFMAAAPTEPGKVESLAGAVSAMYGAFAKDGPTEDEMTVARKQIANNLDEAMKEPNFWRGAIATMDYRDTKLDDVVAAPEALQGITAKQVHEVFAKYFKPDAAFTLTLSPAPSKDEPKKADQPKKTEN